MNITVDECGIVWEEQSHRLFVQVAGLSRIVMATRSQDINLVLDENNVVHWRSLNNRGGHQFSKLNTDLKFSSISGSTATSIEDDVVMRITDKGLLLVDTEIVEGSSNQLEAGNNIPPERFSIGKIPPNLIPVTSTSVIVVKSVIAKIPPGMTVWINISDTVLYGVLSSNKPLRYIHKIVESWEIKTERDIVNLLCWGLNTSLTTNNSTQLLNRKDHNRVKFKTNLQVATLTPEIMIDSTINEYVILNVPEDSILVRYINDGSGREFVIDVNNKYVIDYRFTPIMRMLPKQDVIGFLSGSLIYSDGRVSSLSYGWQQLLSDKYSPDREVDSDKLSRIWVKKSESHLYYNSYSSDVIVGIYNGSVYCRQSSINNEVKVPENTLDGVYRAVISNGQLTNLTSYSGCNISGWADVTRAVRQERHHHVDPYNISEAVLSVIKLSNRRFIQEQISIISKTIDSSGSLLVDIGGGRAGDFNRWLLFKNVVTVEPNSDNYSELLRRSGRHPSIIAINTYGQDLLAITTAINSLGRTTANVVMMNDVLTFFNGESLQQLAHVLNTITESGSYFVFKVMDGVRVLNLLANRGVRQGTVTQFKYGNYSITHEDGSDQIVFSNSGIVGDNQVEYLFYPDQLRELLSGWWMTDRLKLSVTSSQVKTIPLSSQLNDIGREIADLYVYGIWVR